MRVKPYLRFGFAAALVMALFVTGDGYSQRGKGKVARPPDTRPRVPQNRRATAPR